MSSIFGRKKIRWSFVMATLVTLIWCGAVLASSGGEAASGGQAGGIDKVKDLGLRAFNFAVLLGLLIFACKKFKVGSLIDSRRDKIRADLADLESKKRAAEQQLASCTAKLANLDQEVDKILTEYNKDGEAIKAKIIREAEIAAERIRSDANKIVEYELIEAKSRLANELSGQVMQLAEKIIVEKLADTDQDRLVDEYVKQIRTIQ